MVLYESDLYKQAQNALEPSFGLRQIFDLLPPKTEIAIFLDNRIACTLLLVEQKLCLLPRESLQADFQISLHTESIRRLGSRNFDTARAIAQELTAQWSLGYVRLKVLSSLGELHKKGYMNILNRLAFKAPSTLSKLLLFLRRK